MVNNWYPLLWEDHVGILMLKQMIIIPTGEWYLVMSKYHSTQTAVDDMVMVNYKDLYWIELKKLQSLEKFI